MRLLFTIMFLLISENYTAQENYRALYKIRFMVDTVEIKNSLHQDEKSNTTLIQLERSKMIKKYLEVIKISNSVFFNLDFNREKAKFSLPKQIETSTYNTFKRYSRYNGEYYHINDKLFHSKNSFGQDFIVEYPKFDWTITSEAKMIGPYNCFKAITKIEVESSKGKSYHKIIAWFTPEIPFNYGPKEYVGLPGLVLRLDEGNISYNLHKLEKGKHVDIVKPNKGKKITLKEFRSISKKMYESRKF